MLTDWLSDRALRPLYQHCAAFVFPSMYEGFGLPILEAMHCGAPVIAGNNSSQIEVVGDAGMLFNVADAGELAGHLVGLLKEPDRAREMGERAVVRARRFSLGGDGRQNPGGADPVAHPRADGPPAPRAATRTADVGSPSSRPCPRCRPRSRTTRRGCWTS